MVPRRFDAVVFDMACAAVPCADTRHQDFSEADWRLETVAELPRLLGRR